jgi:hypothetical protein
MKRLSTLIAESIIAESIINESVQNLLANDIVMKTKYADQVWDILQNAYYSQGGISGSGFKSKSDMINNIPFWKLDIVDGEVLAVVMYKYKNEDGSGYLRKLVALGTKYDKSRSDLIRKKLFNIMKIEFSRSVMEVSGLAEQYLLKYFKPLYLTSRIKADEVIQLLPHDEIRKIDDYRYERLIGGKHWHEKIMLGNSKDKTFSIPT